MAKPIAYTAFHLNLAFSSVEEAERKTIVERCYWPLLRLADEGLPIGIEATSFTLLEIQKVAPEWLEALKGLIDKGQVELIGSGFCQIIGPLVPPEITAQNLKLGLDDYEALLGCRPQIALVNEQAYSKGILPLYKEAGFEAVMMDWAEPASHNPDWDKAYAQKPQYLAGMGGAQLPVVWSDAISFQKFQRFAHGELSAEEYFAFLSGQVASGGQAIPIYTSDAEVFDYRPGRFSSEAQLETMAEFERIRLLLKTIQNSGEITLALPRDALAVLDKAGLPLRLETSEVPVPVKKQRKYNLTRWGLTGRADVQLNTHCWRLFDRLMTRNREPSADEWRQLCLMWASDYRTHITAKRWGDLFRDLTWAETPPEPAGAPGAELPVDVTVLRSGRFLAIEGEGLHLVLNMYRGLAIQSFGFGGTGDAVSGNMADRGVIGTLAHGYFDDIAYGADFYSGHCVLEPALAHKVADLVRCDPDVSWDCVPGRVRIAATLDVGGGPVKKTICVDLKAQSLEIHYDYAAVMGLPASKRLGFITLNPEFFDRESLFYATHNGGRDLERFALFRGDRLVTVNHGAPVSHLVSASSALGMTGGQLYMGDAENYVALSMRRQDCAGLGMITCSPVRDSFFLRGYISVGELDETSKFDNPDNDTKMASLGFRLRISLGKTAKLL